MPEVTLYENLKKDAGHLPITEIFDRIKSSHYGYLIHPLHRMLKEGNQEGYNRAKLSLPAFTPCALFEGRRLLPNMVSYNHIIVLDIDKLSEEKLIRVKKIICLCDYTYGCFDSPSGNGLKVFVCVSTGSGSHKNAFLALQQFYTALTGVPIDPSGKDITRLCFVSLDPELYFNPAARVFVPLQDSGQNWPPVEPKKPVLLGENINEIPTWATRRPVSPYDSTYITETIQRCKDYVERNCSFVEGQRNTFVFALAIQFRCAGFDEGFTLMEMLQDYNFDEREVRNCVKQAYSYVWQNDPLNTPKANVGAALVAAHDNANEKPADADLQSVPIENPPSPPPEKKPSSKRYNLSKTEALFSQWYETHYNIVTGVIEWRHAHTDEPFQRLEDHHENSMLRQLHHAGQHIPIQMFHILINSDFSPPYNPFIAYKNGLKEWDGATDYIKQLSDTVQTDDDEYFDFCFRKWFVGYAVALVEDDIVNQTVIVFVGIQGIGKTSWMKRLLAPALKNYLGTAALQTDSKDTSIQISECALIILDEMENLNRKDLASFKELITRPEIRIRRPYGRNSENLKHRASFIAAVNSMQILTDPTGSRRYLCSKVNSLDYRHTVDIDGAFAQAYALYKSGFKYWFDMDEIHELTTRNEDFMSKSVEEELIEIWLEPVTREEWGNRHKYTNSLNYQLMTATQVAIKLMEKAKIILGDNTLVKIGKVMHKLNYERVRKGNNFLYMVRVVDGEAVDRESRVLNNPDALTKIDPGGVPSVNSGPIISEPNEDQQIIMLEEDLTDTFVKDDLPF